MEKIKITINEQDFYIKKGLTINEACKIAGFEIPTLCSLENINPKPTACRICVVEVIGARTLVPSCSTPITEGMKIITNSQRVLDARKMNYQLLMASHEDCLSCKKTGNCEFRKVGELLGIKKRIFTNIKKYDIDDSSHAYLRNNNKCILCRRCVDICNEIVGVQAIGIKDRGFKAKITYPFDTIVSNSECIECGQCVLNCPTSALFEKEEIDQVLEYLNDDTKFVIAQTAPAVRVAIGEMFGLEAGTLVTGKMVEALRRIGFDMIVDTTLGADFTIMEEGYEFLERIKNNTKIPQFTSCCPAWINYVEIFYPKLIPYLSTTKSPHQIMGRLLKNYFFKDTELIKNKEIIVVSIMPCVAKKTEKERPSLSINNIKDVDAVLTTREFGKLINISNIDFNSLPDSEFDSIGKGSGAGDIFGVSGGVMEAALRTAYEISTGKKLAMLEFNQIRGDKRIKEGKILLNEKEIKYLVVSTPKAAKPFIEEVLKGKSKYHFIEVMACPNGCIGGGGQPIPTTEEIVKKRMAGLYTSDEKKIIRKSHENPIVKNAYKEFLKEPLSEISERLLHTTFSERKPYKKS